MRFLFPNDYFNAKAIDEAYSGQVVKIGDGQVSDLVGWTAEWFATIRQNIGGLR